MFYYIYVDKCLFCLYHSLRYIGSEKRCVCKQCQRQWTHIHIIITSNTAAAVATAVVVVVVVVASQN